MSSSAVYSGLSWIGETQAKISFYVFLFITSIFALVMIINIMSQSYAYYKSDPTKRQNLKIRLQGSIKLFIILGFIFGLILLFSYWNMEKAEHSKAYAATEGAMDVISDMTRRY
uniref:Uncharacterized protein n=1 Tax=viral metagenome TaxID=1070528 RepID=A0A6C0KSB6_9ZZZZ